MYPQAPALFPSHFPKIAKKYWKTTTRLLIILSTLCKGIVWSCGLVVSFCPYSLLALLLCKCCIKVGQHHSSNQGRYGIKSKQKDSPKSLSVFPNLRGFNLSWSSNVPNQGKRLPLSGWNGEVQGKLDTEKESIFNSSVWAASDGASELLHHGLGVQNTALPVLFFTEIKENSFPSSPHEQLSGSSPGKLCP